jgi:hypothetical protein
VPTCAVGRAFDLETRSATIAKWAMADEGDREGLATSVTNSTGE